MGSKLNILPLLDYSQHSLTSRATGHFKTKRGLAIWWHLYNYWNRRRLEVQRRSVARARKLFVSLGPLRQSPSSMIMPTGDTEILLASPAWTYPTQTHTILSSPSHLSAGCAWLSNVRSETYLPSPVCPPTLSWPSLTESSGRDQHYRR